jgi:hypothetical protein
MQTPAVSVPKTDEEIISIGHSLTKRKRKEEKER